MLRTVLFTALVFGVGMASCVKKDYDCYCLVDFPDTASLSIDYDTTLVLKDRTEEVATVECTAYEEGSSRLIPDGVSEDLVDISCELQ